METTVRGWGMWCGSWMDVDGKFGVFVGVYWWGMEDGRVGRIENGGNLKLKQIWIHMKHHKYKQS